MVRHFRMEPLAEEVSDAEIEEICRRGALPFPLVEGVLRRGVGVSLPLAQRIRKLLHRSDAKRVSVFGHPPQVEFVSKLDHPANRQGKLPENRVIERVPVTELRAGMWLMVTGRCGPGWIEVTGRPQKQSGGYSVSVPTNSGIVVSRIRTIAHAAVLRDHS